MNSRIRTGYVKECHLYGCDRGCNEFESHCEYISVMIVPIDEVEMERSHVKGRLQFGDEPGTEPWTSRELDEPVEPLLVMSVKINTKVR